MTRFCQVALSTLDLDRTYAWYRDELGFLPAGGRRAGGEAVAALAGLPAFDAEVRWLVGEQEFFQLELFGFASPHPRPRPAPERGDEGYVAIGVGAPGRTTGSLRDPDGVIVEVLDAGGPAVRRVTLGVRDLDDARRFWLEAIGLGEREGLLWGGDVALELVAADGLPRPDGYCIADQGIVNVAVGGPDPEAYEQVLGRIRAAGYPHNVELRREEVRAVYLEDRDGISVELLYRDRATAGAAGFVAE